MTIELPIGNGFYISDSLPVSNQECINWYVNIPNAPALSGKQLFGTPGITQLTTTGTILQANRGSWVKGGIPYFVNGNSLYRLDRTFVNDEPVFSYTELGTIEGTGSVSMADNGTQLMVLVPDGKGYIYNEDAATPFQEIIDGDFTANGQPQKVVFVDGYFACNTDGKKWIISSLGDGLSWGALDFSSAESDPDSIVSLVVLNNQVYVIGSETIEGFQNVGGFGFPFIRNNVYLDKGCIAPFSVVKSNKHFYMIGKGENESPAIWSVDGSSYNKISTVAIESLLEKYSDTQIENSTSYSYSIKGAYFVCFSLPDRTLVYNQSTQIWSEQKSLLNEVLTRWRVFSIVQAYGKTIGFDVADGRVGEITPDVYTEYGENIIRIASFQPFTDYGGELVFPQIELTMESGVGNQEVPDPEVSLSISKDGKIFGPERVRKIGKVGDYKRRIFWRKNGRMPRMVVFKIRLSDAVKPVLIKMEAE